MDKKYEAQIHEPQIQAQWEREGTFTANKQSEKPLFSIDTPPPTISGSLHIGHIFSYTQTDIIARYKRLCSFNVFYPFGFDDNGLATERFVEKKNKVSGYHMGRAEFIKLCLEESHESEKTFEALWKRMGISADWTQTYSTIAPLAQKISQRSFLDLYEKGFIYRREEPALYCTLCRTSVAQAELDDTEQASSFNDIVFETKLGKDAIISTTRPELLSSCVALFFHPDDKRYQTLNGTTARVPLFDYEIPVLPDELVDPEKGTGLVMCCTFGDKNDIAWYKKHKLPYRQSVGFDGVWTKETGILAGLKAPAAREKVLEELKHRGLLVSQKDISHTVNVHERCKKEIEYIVLTQWFLNILDNKQEFLHALDKIEWHPAFMKTRCKDWIQNLQWDWCLSRQRFYGIPFPVWHCTSCKQVITASPDKLPIDPQEQAYGHVCPSCRKDTVVPDTDVMDTWNTSSLTPYICAALYDEKSDSPFALQATEDRPHSDFLPMGMRPQAHDIIRTWAFYTIIKTLLHNKCLPWKDIVISGHVLSKDRDKISKSQGNTPIDPENLLKVYPADVIRFWTASGTLGQDVSFSETQLQIGQRLTTKLWNAFRFVEEHITQAPESQQPEQLGTLNEWLCHQATICFETYSNYLNQYEFSLALHSVEQFFWNDFCDNYLELIKDQLFNPDKYDQETITATRWTLYYVGLRILQMLAPYTPFITETLYQTFYAKKIGVPSLHLTSFADTQISLQFADSATTINMVLHLVSTVRKLKTSQQLSLKTPLASLTIYNANQELLKLLVPHETLVKGVTQAETIAYEFTSLDEAMLEKHGDAWTAKVAIEIVP
jgi:valyl-tRNA synthetase